MFFPGLGLVIRIMVCDYRRGWEDALDVVLEINDMDEVMKIRDRLRETRISFLQGGPFLIPDPQIQVP